MVPAWDWCLQTNPTPLIISVVSIRRFFAQLSHPLTHSAAPRRIVDGLERAYRRLPRVRARYLVALALVAVVGKTFYDVAVRPADQTVVMAAFNSVTSFVRERPQELIDADYYRSQTDAFLRQFHQSAPDIPRFEVFIDPTELHRLEQPFDDDQNSRELTETWRRWYPLGQRKSAVAFLKRGEDYFPVYMRVRGTGSNHFLGPAKSWRLTRINLPGERPWGLPSDIINLTLPEHYLVEWLAFEMAERAGMATPYVEPATLYINGVYQGVRQAGGQTGPSFMRRKGLPIGFLIDSRMDRWDQPGQPPPEVLYDYRFGNRRLGADYRDGVELKLTDDQIIDLFVFYMLYRPAHMVDLRLYVDPLYRSVTLIPWNLEIPRSNPKYFATSPPINRRTLDIALTNFEDLGSVNFIFRDLIYPRVTPQMIYEILAKTYEKTRAGAPLNLDVVKQHYLDEEARFAGELEAFPYWYGSRDFDFIKDTRVVAEGLKNDVLFHALNQAYGQMDEELARFEATCGFSPNGQRNGVIGRLQCATAAGVGAVLTDMRMSQDGGSPDVVWDRNQNGRVDRGDRLLSDGAELFGPEGFHLFYDGRELLPFYESGALNSYDFLLVGSRESGVPAAVGLRHPLDGRTKEVAVAPGQKGDFGSDVTLADLEREDLAPPVPREEPPALPAFIKKFGDRAYGISAGTHEIKGLLALPPGASLTLDPGATLIFAPEAGLYISGPIFAEGTDAAPIVLRSRDPARPGGGLIVNYTKGLPSRLSHCRVEGLAGQNINRVPYDGAVSFLGGKLELRSCVFADIPAAAGLRLAWAEADIADTTFSDLAGDGLLAQSSAASLARVRVERAGRDGLRFVDSNARVTDAVLQGAGDSALVAKRRSLISLRDSDIQNARHGLRISDDSHVTATDSAISCADLGVYVNWEEPNRNGMTVSLSGIAFEENRIDVLRDPGTPERAIRREGEYF